MASRSTDVEILVHVAAPSRTADDAVYRQLARAYLSFQPDHRTALSRATETTEGGGDDARIKTCAKAPPSASSQEFATAAAENLFGPESQDLSFRSAFDNRSSPRLPPANAVAPRGTDPAPSQTSEAPAASSFCAPASQISDSYPLPDLGGIKVTPTRVLERYLDHFKAHRDAPTSPTVSREREAPRDGAALGENHLLSSLPGPNYGQEPDQSHYRAEAREVIPVTPLVPQTLTRKRKTFVEPEDHPAFDMTHVSSSMVSIPMVPSSSRAESEPLPGKKPRMSQVSVDSVNLVRSSSDSGPVRSSNATAIEHIVHTLEIRPPSPPPGISHIEPPDLVSEEFSKLANDLSARYRPKETRAPEALERGCWLIDCSSWSPQTRLDTWVFLTNYLRSGLAGWGVWCSRDAAHDRIRLYGWGCVAKNTYLLLYLASGRQVKTTGAKWLDADGKVALEVPPSEKRTG